MLNVQSDLFLCLREAICGFGLGDVGLCIRFRRFGLINVCFRNLELGLELTSNTSPLFIGLFASA